MSLAMIILIVVALLLLGVIPVWPHSHSWGYAPSSTLGVIIIIIMSCF